MPEWKSISSTAKDLVLKMLSPNPLHRPSISEVLDHPWMRVSAESIVMKKNMFFCVCVCLCRDGKKGGTISSHRLAQNKSFYGNLYCVSLYLENSPRLIKEHKTKKTKCFISSRFL